MKSSSIQIQSVLYHNDKDALLRSLEGLARAIELDRADRQRLSGAVVRYGDASPQPIFTREQLDEARARFQGVFDLQYVFFGENTGTAKGHNRLLGDCQSDYVMDMNPDVLVMPRFFAEILAPFDRSSKVGLVEARQTPIEHPKDYDSTTGETSWASTACVVFPTRVAREVGGFDEQSFFMYCDDVDFSWRVRLQGYSVIYAPRAIVFHGKRLSARGQWQPTSAERYYSLEAALMLAHKWSNEELCRTLLEQFSHSPDPSARKAAAEYRRRRDEGLLPAALDPGHKVAEFVSGNYAKHRFAL